jgi:hypothetical protein
MAKGSRLLAEFSESAESVETASHFRWENHVFLNKTNSFIHRYHLHEQVSRNARSVPNRVPIRRARGRDTRLLPGIPLLLRVLVFRCCSVRHQAL